MMRELYDAAQPAFNLISRHRDAIKDVMIGTAVVGAYGLFAYLIYEARRIKDSGEIHNTEKSLDNQLST